jgi:protein TonB
MFENLVESTQGKKQGRSAYFLVTAVLWVAVLTSAIVYGIVQYNAVLNEAEDTATLLAPPPPPPPPPPPAAAPLPKTKVEAPTGFVAAKEPPKEIKKPSAAPPVIASSYSGEGVAGGVIGGQVGGVPGGAAGGVVIASPTEPPPPPPPKVIRKSGGVLQGSALNKVEPSYPPLAKAAHVTGSVMVEITIDENGRVISASALSGHPLLKDAAVQAARGWKFAPTMLSGVPVKVIGTITFNFQM